MTSDPRAEILPIPALCVASAVLPDVPQGPQFAEQLRYWGPGLQHLYIRDFVGPGGLQNPFKMLVGVVQGPAVCESINIGMLQRSTEVGDRGPLLYFSVDFGLVWAIRTT